MKNLRYKCLVFDHDDTTVDSTAHIHYPSFLKSLAILRPEMRMTLEEYFAINCTPGFLHYLTETAKFTEEELQLEYNMWLAYAETHTPVAYAGIRELMETQRENGGYICMVSHNIQDNVFRDLKRNDLPLPDLFFGGDLPREQRKPAPYPLQEIMRRYELAPSDILMIDDLIPGQKMASAAGTDFATACWGHNTQEVREYMAAHGAPCFESVKQLSAYLFE